MFHRNVFEHLSDYTALVPKLFVITSSEPQIEYNELNQESCDYI